MAGEYKKPRKPSTRDLCLVFLVFLIAAAALGISIFLLVEKLGEDKDNENATKAPNEPAAEVGDKGEGTTESPGHYGPPVARGNAVIPCYADKNPTEATCRAAGCVWKHWDDSKMPSCIFPDNVGYRHESSTVNGNVETFKLRRTGNMATIYNQTIKETVTLEVYTYSDHALRIKFSTGAAGEFKFPEEALKISTTGTNTNNRLYDVKTNQNPFSLQVIRRATNTVIFDTDLPGLILSEQFLQISTKLASDYVYGFGEHNHRRFRHDLNWKQWSMFTRDAGPQDHWNLYGQHPTYLNVEAGGNANMVLLLNSHAMDVLLQPAPAITYKTIGGMLDFYIFLGPTPNDAVQQYTNAIGNPVMPPYWSLGFHLCRWGYPNLTVVENVVDRNLKAMIPQDVQWGDIDYMFEKFLFTVDKRTFSGLPQFVDKLHNMNKKYIVIVDPGVGSNKTIYDMAKKNSKNYNILEDGQNRNIFVRNAKGGFLEGVVWPGTTMFPDFTNPNTTQWWADWINYFYTVEGVKADGLWIDMDEPASFVPGSTESCERNKWNNPPYVPPILEGEKDNGSLYYKTLCMDAKQHWGLHYQVHSLYGHSESIATYNALTLLKPNTRPFIVTRSSFVGTSKYAAHWLGDNQATWSQLRDSIVGMLEFSMFGFSMIGSDICGFWMNSTYELCLRWQQVGAFYPFSRNHNGFGFDDQDPASFDESFQTVVRNALLTRYKLLPYFYTLFYQAHTQGTMVAKPLMFEFPEDSLTYDIDRQFMIGPGLLVSPVLEEGKREVDAYFPADSAWYSYYDGSKAEEGKVNKLDAPLEYLPLHFRGGTIIPYQEPELTTEDSRRNNFGLVINLDHHMNAEGTLYLDDGESLDYTKKNSYTLISFAVRNGYEFNMNIESDGYKSVLTKTIEAIEINGLYSAPGRVLVDGAEKPEADIRLKYNTVQILNLNLVLSRNHNMTWNLF